MLVGISLKSFLSISFLFSKFYFDIHMVLNTLCMNDYFNVFYIIFFNGLLISIWFLKKCFRFSTSIDLKTTGFKLLVYF